MNVLFFLTPKCDTAYIYNDSTLRQALEKIKYHGYTAIPVIDHEGKYVGTLSEGDLLWAILNYSLYGDHEKEHYYIRDILTSRQNTSVNIASGIDDLFVLSLNQNFVPVTDDRDIFIGIVTRKKIMQYYFYEKDNQNEFV